MKPGNKLTAESVYKEVEEVRKQNALLSREWKRQAREHKEIKDAVRATVDELLVTERNLKESSCRVTGDVREAKLGLQAAEKERRVLEENVEALQRVIASAEVEMMRVRKEKESAEVGLENAVSRMRLHLEESGREINWAEDKLMKLEAELSHFTYENELLQAKLVEKRRRERDPYPIFE